MKLLLDEMINPDIARQLRRRGHDVVAVSEREDLRTGPDTLLFTVAQREGRGIVTENVPDFRKLAGAQLRGGASHAGLIFTPNSAFPRGNPRTIGRVVTALGRLLDADSEVSGQEVWLHPP